MGIQLINSLEIVRLRHLSAKIEEGTSTTEAGADNRCSLRLKRLRLRKTDGDRATDKSTNCNNLANYPDSVKMLYKY